MDDPSSNEGERPEANPNEEGFDAQEQAPAPLDALEEARQEAARFKDQLLRTAADLDNFRKRSRREQAEAERKSREDFLRDLLPVFDNLERAVSHAEKATDVASVVEGIQMVMRQFSDTLGKLKIERIPTVGQPFDPAVHEAIQQLETADYPTGSVAAEIQAGYRTPDRVIRPALVVVAKAPQG